MSQKKKSINGKITMYNRKIGGGFVKHRLEKKECNVLT